MRQTKSFLYKHGNPSLSVRSILPETGRLRKG